MRIVSSLLKHVVYPGLSKAGYLRWPAESGPAVLTYHGILPPGYTVCDSMLDGNLLTADEFRPQLRWLKAKYNVISPQEFRLWCDSQVELAPRSVLLTCDDGLLNTLTDMLPIIREFDLPFLFFVTGASTLEKSSMLWYEQLFLWLSRTKGSIKLEMPWRREPYVALTRPQKCSLWQESMRQLAALPANTREKALAQVRIQIGISENWHSEYSQNEPLRRRFFMLNRRELQDLADAGMTIGAHTVSHPMLAQLVETEAFYEISESRTQLEKALGSEVWALAYPFGTSEAAGVREARLAHRAGFACAFMNGQSLERNRFLLPRIHVSRGMTLAEIEAHASGLHRGLQEKHSRSDIASGS
jgi:peptidoglycan/xylan/chitin deacetylase (PgdA/CDA1 family)